MGLKTPWEQEGVSRRTYYRNKSAKSVPSATDNGTKSEKVPNSATPVDKSYQTGVVEGMEKKYGKSMSDAIDHAIKSVNESEGVLKAKLKGAV